jgi:hypothetical protein
VSLIGDARVVIYDRGLLNYQQIKHKSGKVCQSKTRLLTEPFLYKSSKMFGALGAAMMD